MRFDKRESKKSKSGYTWRVTFEYKDSYGRKKKYSKSGFATKKAAQVHALAVQSDLAKGLVVDNTVHTVDELFHQMVQLPGYSPNTIRTYSDNYKVHIGPFLGDADIKDLHYPELQLFFASKSSVGKSAVKTSKSILKNIGILAVKAGYISDWPIDLVSLSGVDNSRHHESGGEYLPETDFRKLVDRVSSGWNTFSCGARAMFLLLGYYLGLRISEASALKWEDVDLVRKTVTIRRQLVYVGINAPEYYTIDMTKTQKSRATLPIPAPLLDALEQWREYNPYPYVLCLEDGRFLDPKQTRRTIKDYAADLGFSFHPHMLRHTFITNLVLAGTDPKTIAELARHKSPVTSLQIYTEITDVRMAEAVARTFEDETPDLKA